MKNSGDIYISKSFTSSESGSSRSKFTHKNIEKIAMILDRAWTLLETKIIIKADLKTFTGTNAKLLFADYRSELFKQIIKGSFKLARQYLNI